jgi:hypothetical protein
LQSTLTEAGISDTVNHTASSLVQLWQAQHLGPGALDSSSVCWLAHIYFLARRCGSTGLCVPPSSCLDLCWQWSFLESCLCRAPALLLLAGSALTLSDQLVAAVGASCAVSLVATPTELLKCRLQAQGCSVTARQRLVGAGLDPSQHTIYRTPIGM